MCAHRLHDLLGWDSIPWRVSTLLHLPRQHVRRARRCRVYGMPYRLEVVAWLRSLESVRVLHDNLPHCSFSPDEDKRMRSQ